VREVVAAREVEEREEVKGVNETHSRKPTA
jgi:hypothetical protein